MTYYQFWTWKKKSEVQNWLMGKILECHITFKLHIHTMPHSNHPMHNASQQLPPCTMMKTTHQMINGLYTTIYLHLLQPTSTCPNDASRCCLGVTYVFFFFFSFCLFFNYTTCSFNQHPLTWCIHLHPPYPMFVETMFQDIVWA